MTLRVAVDLTPLLGARTGVGLVVDSVAQRLCRLDGIEPTGLLVSWRGATTFADRVPNGWRRRRLGLPARACHHLWRSWDRPAVKGFDIVHGLNYVVPPAAGGAELVAVHDLTAWRFPELVDVYSKHNPVLLDRALARGAHVHTGSHFVADELVNDLGIDPERVHTTPYGCTPPLPGVGEAGLSEVGAEYVLAIGTVEPRKDYVGLVHAMNLVWEVFPTLRLVIAGRPGWGVDALDEAIAGCRRPNQVIVTGFIDEQTKADLLAECRVLIYPSLYEGFGFPLLEAMAAGVPVVSTTAGSIPEVASDAAVLVPPRDSIELAEAISRVSTDETLRSELIDRGQRRVTVYNWDDTVSAIETVYRQLAGDNVTIGTADSFGRGVRRLG